MRYQVNNKETFITLIQHELLSSIEAAEYLGISKQALNSLVQREKLIPVKTVSRDKLFLKEDLEERKAASKELKQKYRPYDSKK